MENILYLVLMAIFLARSSVAITDEQCAEFDYLGVCSSNLQEAFMTAKESGNLTNACLAIETYIECVEYVACECKLTTVSDVHNQLTYIGGVYTFQNCENMTGPLITHKGIPCQVNGTGSPTEGDLLVLTTAEAETILELDQSCNGIKACYVSYDTKAALALHARNLPQLCTVLEDTISCLEHAACRCGDDAIANITKNVIANHQIYTQTCSVVNPDILPKNSIKCAENGTAIQQTICDTGNPIYKCYIDLDDALQNPEISKPLRCSALKTYIQCTESIACECGFIRSPSVYRAVTVAAASFNDSVCADEIGPLVVVSGMDCPDGSGTNEGEDRLIIALSEDPSVMELDSICPGIKSCYADLDEATGIALFEKNIKKLCAGQKVFIECMEETYCQCGRYSNENTTNYLIHQRENHVAACFTDSILRDSYECKYGAIGFKCRGNSDCGVIRDSECSPLKECRCKAGHKYQPDMNPTSCINDIDSRSESRCSSAADCHHIDGAHCGANGFCACHPHHQLTENKMQCEPVSSAPALTTVCTIFYGFLSGVLVLYHLHSLL